ncbi:MAG: YceI family protein [Cyclobacteriaceae bacterium]
MKKLTLIIAVIVLFFASAFVIHRSTDWKVKEGYTVKVFRNAQIQFPTYFKGLKAEISFDEAHPEKSTIKATIDATTVDTGNELMTAHAKEESVLHTDKYPVITFESSSIRKSGKGYEITGNLTLKGITKPVTFPFTFENETFVGAFSIFAKDFNITRSGAVPSGEIKIELTIPVAK